MNNLLKATCLLMYVLALLSFVVELPMGAGPWLKLGAIGLLVIHSIELPFVWKYVRAYEGGLKASLAFTLLFGLLHWMPIAKQMKSSAQGGLR